MANTPDVQGRRIGRIGRERADRSVAWVERDDGAPVRVPAAAAPGGPGAVDPVAQRLLGCELQLHVEGQANLVAGMRRDDRRRLTDRGAERIDAQDVQPGRSAQVAVVDRLDAALADRVSRVVTLLAEGVKLLLRDLADVAEHMRGELPVGVVAEIFVRDLDAREVVAALLQVADLQLGRAVLDRHR